MSSGALVASLWLATAAAKPAAPTADDIARWPLQRALWSEASRGQAPGVVLVERAPAPPLTLGPHQGVSGVDLDACWLQHAGAADEDLDVAFCADVDVDGSGKVKASLSLVPSADPTKLGRCISTLLTRVQSAPGMPSHGTICRAVQTHTTEAAREAWAKDPTTRVRAAAPETDPWGTAEPGRADRENAVTLDVVEIALTDLGGPLTELMAVPAPLGAKDRTVATARRHLDVGMPAIRACAGRHLSWRAPDAPVAALIELTVSDAGVSSTRGVGSEPPGYGDVATCIATSLDPGITPAAGDRRLVVPVLIAPEQVR